MNTQSSQRYFRAMSLWIWRLRRLTSTRHARRTIRRKTVSMMHNTWLIPNRSPGTLTRTRFWSIIRWTIWHRITFHSLWRIILLRSIRISRSSRRASQFTTTFSSRARQRSWKSTLTSKASRSLRTETPITSHTMRSNWLKGINVRWQCGIRFTLGATCQTLVDFSPLY